MKIDYSKLEKKINIKFKNKDLLIRSLTHKSFDRSNNYEKIEFLGDRVLGLIIAKKLLEIYPNEKEGILDKKYASLVNKKTCLEIAKCINLQDYILIFNPKNKFVDIEDKVLSDSCEALIGAIYLEKCFNITEKVILDLLREKIKESVITQIDAKTKLQELSQQKIKKLPEYSLVKKEGPSHSPIFTVSLKVLNLKKIRATCTSIREAEKKAAKIALVKLDD